MSKVELKKKQKENALMDTAFELFTSKGIAKTSVSDIAKAAGVAKGTFYLYFTDKYDINNRLIAYKASEVFKHAYERMEKDKPEGFENQMLCMVDGIIERLNRNKLLLAFISKNLGWGVFKEAIIGTEAFGGTDVMAIYRKMLEESKIKYANPELLIFMVVELVGSTCYNVILHKEPVELKELKPILYDTIRQLIRSQELR